MLRPLRGRRLANSHTPGSQNHDPTRIKLSVLWLRAGVWSLKGSNKSAQGNALGIEGRIPFTSPERA